MTVNTAGRTVTLPTRVRPQLSTRALIRGGLLTVICLVPFALLAPFFDGPLMNDEGIFATIAVRMMHGALPYRDLFDIAPPVIYGYYALSFRLFGQYGWAPHVMLALTISLTTLLIYFTAKHLFGERAGYAAAIAYALSAGLTRVGVWALHEYVALLPTVGALLAFSVGMQRQRGRMYLIAGLLSSLALVTNQLTAVQGAALFVLAVVFAWRSHDEPRLFHRYRAPLLFLAGASVAPVLITALYVGLGAGHDLYYGAVQYPLLYGSAMPWGRRLHLAMQTWGRFCFVAGPWLLLALVGLGRLLRRRDERSVLVGVWALVSPIAISATGRFHVQYFVLVFPAMAILIGFCAGNSGGVGLRRWHGRLFYLLVLATAVASVSYNINPYLKPSTVARSIAKPQSASRVREAQSMLFARYIASVTDKNDMIFELGRQGELYFYADRRPASRYFHEFPWRTDPRTIDKTIQDLERNRPVYIIDTLWPTYIEGIADLYMWQILPFLAQNYVYEGRVYFDPELMRMYESSQSSLGEYPRLTYYADLYRLKDAAH